MKIVLYIVAAVLILSGGVWFLQGVGILPGSFMTGPTRWAIYGGLAFLAGCAALVFGIRLRPVKK
jgi:hypothetical protein